MRSLIVTPFQAVEYYRRDDIRLIQLELLASKGSVAVGFPAASKDGDIASKRRGDNIFFGGERARGSSQIKTGIFGLLVCVCASECGQKTA